MFSTKVISLAAGMMALSSYSYGADVTLEVSNITKQTGNIIVAVYDSQSAYAQSGQPISTAKIPAESATVSTVLTELKSGEYAVKIFHDENSNGQLDTNMVGMPKEGYGFSNNGGRFGPASFDEAKVTVDQDTKIAINLR